MGIGLRGGNQRNSKRVQKVEFDIARYSPELFSLFDFLTLLDGDVTSRDLNHSDRNHCDVSDLGIVGLR